jgi:hypothetical protein
MMTSKYKDLMNAIIRRQLASTHYVGDTLYNAEIFSVAAGRLALNLVKMTRWLVRLLSQEAGKWSGTSINSGIRTVGQ